MIISTLHKFIFTAIPKTGTHSVREALREQLGPNDMEQAKLLVRKAFPIPELAKLQHGHISLEQVRPFLTAEQFDSYFKFAFVRNPFDRFISFCAFMTRNQQDIFQRDPESVMRYFTSNPPMGHLLFQPQFRFVTDAQGGLLADYVGRVERMQESYDEICRRIGIPATPLDKVNSSKRGDYRSYYDTPLVEAVAKLYARDFEMFGYEF